MCRVISWVVGTNYDQHVLWTKLLAFALLHFVLQGQNASYFGIFWFPTFAFQSPMMKRASSFGDSSRRLKVCIELVNFSFFSISGWGIDVDSCDVEWFALEMILDHSVIFEIVPNAAFWTPLLTMRATPFLLRDSCQ